MTRIRGSFSAAMFDERAVREHERIVELIRFFKLLEDCGLKSIITCNYDTIVECVLGTSGFNYGRQGEQLTGRGINPQFPWQDAHLKVAGRIPLVKLHGSLSWGGGGVKYTSGKPGRSGKAFIVPPSHEKVPPSELRDVWDLGARVLKQSKLLVVFGFAFNPYDEALLNYLKENGSNVNSVLLVDPFPKVESANELRPNCQIDTLDPRGDFDICEWVIFSKNAEGASNLESHHH